MDKTTRSVSSSGSSIGHPSPNRGTLHLGWRPALSLLGSDYTRYAARRHVASPVCSTRSTLTWGRGGDVVGDRHVLKP